MDVPTTRRTGAATALLDLVPADGNRPYDMRKVIEEIVDDGDYLEVHERWATQHHLRPGPARRPGRRHRRQPARLARRRAGHRGVARRPPASSRCATPSTSRSSPCWTSPASCPGVAQEHGGIIRHGAKLLYAYCNATVPRISLILRKAYGGAYIVMDSQSIGADLTFAWPTNEIAVMGAEGAANVIFRRQIAEADDPEAMRARMVKEYKAELMHPYYAAERGLVDDVIDPAETREVLISSLAMLRTKHADLPSRKHGNPPAVTGSHAPS